MAVAVPSIRGGQVEKFAPGDRITHTVEAGQTVRGGRLVAFTGNRQVREAPVGSLKVSGVAMYDGAAGAKVGVASEGVWFLIAAGAIAAGDRVEAAADGTVRVLTAIDAAGSFHPAACIGHALEDIADTVAGPIQLGGSL